MRSTERTRQTFYVRPTLKVPQIQDPRSPSQQVRAGPAPGRCELWNPLENGQDPRPPADKRTMPTSTMNHMHVSFGHRESGGHYPPGLIDYLEIGLNEKDAQRWFAAGISPNDVEHFARLEMSLAEVRSWGLRPELVERFKSLRFTKEEACAWAQAPVWPDRAVIWRH